MNRDSTLWIAVALGAVLSAPPRPAPAQAPPAAVAPAPAPPPYFVYLRYGAHSPEYAFASYSFGTPAVMVGIISDAAAGYDEVQAGAGVNLYAPSGNGAAFYAMGSRATDSWYLELYALPTLTAGRLSVTSFAGTYVPLEDAGVRQVFVDPVTALVRVAPRLSLGASSSWYKVDGYPGKLGAGPALQVAIPRGSVTVDALRGLAHFRDEVRVTVQLAFE